MKFLILKLFLLLLHVMFVNMANCELNIGSHAEPPVFLNVTDEHNIIILKPKPKYSMSEGDKLIAICPGGIDFTVHDGQDSAEDSSASLFIKSYINGGESESESESTSESEESESEESESEESESESEESESEESESAESESESDTDERLRRRDIQHPRIKELLITCDGSGTIDGKGEDADTGKDIHHYIADNLSCNIEDRFEIFMKIGFDSCSYNYYGIGIKVHDKIYEFLQICFDLRGMRPIFVRFIARTMKTTLSSYGTSRAIDDTQQWWETDARYKTARERGVVKTRHGHYKELQLPNYNFFISSEKLEKLTALKFGKHRGSVIYHEVNLYPTDYFGTFFKGIIPDKLKLQTTLGWQPLFEGNWKLFLRSLVKRVRNVPYEIFIGKSHYAEAPKDVHCVGFDNMIIKDNGKQVVIPQYIWALLSNNHEKIVVVGVNTPYYPVWDYKNPLPCESMCDTIDWLGILHKFTEVSTLGLIYCCDVNEVAQFLHGFPRNF